MIKNLNSKVATLSLTILISFLVITVYTLYTLDSIVANLDVTSKGYSNIINTIGNFKLSFIFLIAIFVIGILTILYFIILKWIKKTIGDDPGKVYSIASELLNSGFFNDYTISKNSTGILKILNEIRQNFGGVILTIKDAVERFEVSIDELNTTAHNLSQTSNDQAANTEEIVASVEEITATITQNAENAKNTNIIATETAEDTEKGSAAVEETIEAMKMITEKIGFIENIASQTNLLSLNASIEAAKAESYGKGFAVVANEVKKLSDKSQVVSQEINDIASINMTLGEEANLFIRNTISKMRKTAELVQEIAMASDEQKNGIDNINIGMDHLNQITQNNAALSEELASSVQNLKDYAMQLKDITTMFEVDN